MNRVVKNRTVREGAPMPLFDRLIDFKPHVKSEQLVQNFLDEEGLKQSIAQELENILDSRIADEIDLPEGDEGYGFLMPEQFGLRDFSSLTAQSERGLRDITSHIRTAILRFEPRLLNPRVHIIAARKEKTDIEVEIHGLVIIDKAMVPMMFPLTLHNLFGRRSK
jgi:type VI secretion system protein ImpF